MWLLLLWTAMKNTTQAHLQKLIKEKDEVATRLKTIEKDHVKGKQGCYASQKIKFSILNLGTITSYRS